MEKTQMVLFILAAIPVFFALCFCLLVVVLMLLSKPNRRMDDMMENEMMEKKFGKCPRGEQAERN